MYRIEHKGKVLETSHFSSLTNEECEELRKAYYQKPSFDLVKQNFISIEKGGTNVSTITSYYLKDLMAKVKLYSPRWSIEEVLECNDLIRYFWSRVMASEKVYPKTHSPIKNLETAFRISGGGVAMKPSNFPMKTIDYILQKYNLNNNYYDYSCGWGVRMLSSFKMRVNYYGVDPNYILIDRLNEIKTGYEESNQVKVFSDIRCVGSEQPQEDWVSKFGLAFSSPPYFGLEDYKIGEQSYKEGMEYSDWLNNYLTKTIENIFNYLIPNGNYLINIKGYKNYPLSEDAKRISEAIGLKYQESITLKNITRPSAKEDINTDESILVFKK